MLVPDDWEAPLEIRLRITDAAGAELFAGETSTARMRRSFAELVDWLLRDNPVPAGSVLLTGTGLVPPDDFTLEPGHVVEIHVPGIGTLINPVVPAAELLSTKKERDPCLRSLEAPRAAGVRQLRRRRVAAERVRRARTRNATPGGPSEAIGEFPASGAEDVDAAVEAAAARLPGVVAAARRRSARRS